MTETRQRRILVVDGDVPTLHLVREHLEAAGFDVLTATSGQVALSQIVLEGPRSPIHGVLLDSEICAQGGTPVVREIKGWDPSIRVIMMSDGVRSTRVFNALQDGVDDLLTKPIDPSSLRETCLREFAS